jgi:hypothetical protein
VQELKSKRARREGKVDERRDEADRSRETDDDRKARWGKNEAPGCVVVVCRLAWGTQGILCPPAKYVSIRGTAAVHPTGALSVAPGL